MVKSAHSARRARILGDVIIRITSGKAAAAATIACAFTLLAGCGGSDSETAPADDASAPEAGSQDGEADEPRQELAEAATCPPAISTQAPDRIPAGATVQGIHIGMTYDEARATLECEFPGFDISATGGGFQVNTYQSGAVVRQSIVAANLPIGQKLRTAGDERTDVALMGHPGEEKVYGVVHRRFYETDTRPPVANVERALVRKYGEPSYDVSQGGYKLSYWVFDVDGNPEAFNIYGGSRACAPQQIQPANIGTPAVPHAVEGCGFSVSSIVYPATDNPALTSSMSVSMADPHGTMLSLTEVQEKLDADEAVRRAREAEQAADEEVDL